MTRNRPTWAGETRDSDAYRDRRPYGSKHGRFLRVSKAWFWRGTWATLGDAARNVFFVMLHLADGTNPYRPLELSDADLAYYTGRCRATVLAGLCELLDAGLIDGRRGTGGARSEYRLTPEAIADVYGHPEDVAAYNAQAQAQDAAQDRTGPHTPGDNGKAGQPLADTVKTALAEAQAAIPARLWQAVSIDLGLAAKSKTLRAQVERAAQNGDGALLNALAVYADMADRQDIRNPSGLLRRLLEQTDLTAETAAPLLKHWQDLADMESRQAQERETWRRETERAREAQAALAAVEFTPDQVAEYGPKALAAARRLTRNAAQGGTLWKLEMQRLIDQDAGQPLARTQGEHA